MSESINSAECYAERLEKLRLQSEDVPAKLPLDVLQELELAAIRTSPIPEVRIA